MLGSHLGKRRMKVAELPQGFDTFLGRVDA